MKVGIAVSGQRVTSVLPEADVRDIEIVEELVAVELDRPGEDRSGSNHSFGSLTSKLNMSRCIPK